MLKKIDLLPPELRANSRVVGIARRLRYFSMIMVVFVFFFQAEDGIRDKGM